MNNDERSERLLNQRGEVRTEVTPALSADAYGNVGADVLATPAVVGLCEQAAIRALEPHLEGSEMSVGTYIELSHQRATRMGWSIVVSATVREVTRHAIWFDIAAVDQFDDIVATGRHCRAIVDKTRFFSRLNDKK